jgi:hypothetical protein
MKVTPCRGCGKPIVFAKMDGKIIPLDPRPPVYEVTEDDGTNPPTVRRASMCHVSHFATCPKAGDFSASKKNASPQRERPT